MKKMWKCLKDGMKSGYDDSEWVLNKWRITRKKPIRCGGIGFHACDYIVDAMNYVTPGLICQVEVRGKSDIGGDKSAYQQMRVVSVYEWKKEDSVSLAIFAAELVIDNYEQQYPNDNRPRNAIEAAKKYLRDASEKNRNAARSARSAARSAWDAARSAWDAARSAACDAAWDAARYAAWDAACDAARYAGSAGSAESAARYAACDAAWDAAESAGSAACDAARSAGYAAVKEIKQKIQAWIEDRIEKGEKK